MPMWLLRQLKAHIFSLLVIVPAIFSQNPSNCLQQTVLVDVVDNHGRVPTGLTKDSFRFTYRGHSITPQNAVYSEGPRRVLILLDMSGSMRDRAAWTLARTAAWEVASNLPAGSQVGLMTFSERA